MNWKQMSALFLVLSAVGVEAYGEAPVAIAVDKHKNGIIVANGRVVRIHRDVSLTVNGTSQPPVDYYNEINQAVAMAATCANTGIPSQSGTLPSGATYNLQIQGSQFTYDYRGPLGAVFNISGDLASGHGAVQGTLPSGSTVAWSW